MIGLLVMKSAFMSGMQLEVDAQRTGVVAGGLRLDHLLEPRPCDVADHRDDAGAAERHQRQRVLVVAREHLEALGRAVDDLGDLARGRRSPP